MRPQMLHTALKISTTRNAYGDYILGATTSLACHFRDISQVAQKDGAEQYDCDALAWFEPSSGVVKNDILQIENVKYQVNRVINARKLNSPVIQFIKVELVLYGTIS